MPNPNIKFEILEETITASQGINIFKRVERILRWKVRFIIICSDTEREAYADMWEPKKSEWLRIANLTPAEMQTALNPNNNNRHHFLADHKILARMVRNYLQKESKQND